MRRFALAAAALVLLVGASETRAGGIDVRLAVTARAVWATTGSAVFKIDPRSGRIIGRPSPALPYPIAVDAVASAAWIASVENGFAAGAVTRIDGRSGIATTRFRLVRAPVLAVAASADAVWVLAGTPPRARLVRIDPRTGRQVRAISVRRAVGWLAADRSGAWLVDGQGSLIHVDRRTHRPRTVARLRDGAGRIALGGGSVWALDGRELVRIDKITGRVRARLEIGATPIDVAVGGRAVWVLRIERQRVGALVRVDPKRDRISGLARIAHSPSALAVGAGAVWVGSMFPAPGLLRVEPRTMRVRLFARLA